MLWKGFSCHIPPLKKKQRNAITPPQSHPIPSLNSTFSEWGGTEDGNGISPCFFAFLRSGIWKAIFNASFLLLHVAYTTTSQVIHTLRLPCSLAILSTLFACHYFAVEGKHCLWYCPLVSVTKETYLLHNKQRIAIQGVYKMYSVCMPYLQWVFYCITLKHQVWLKWWPGTWKKING